MKKIVQPILVLARVMGFLILVIPISNKPATGQEGIDNDSGSPVVSIPQEDNSVITQKFKITFKPGIEMGYGRVYRKYHIEWNPYYDVLIDTKLANGHAFHAGVSAELGLNPVMNLNFGVVYEFQLFQSKEILSHSTLTEIRRLLNQYYSIPVMASINLHAGSFILSPGIGIKYNGILSSVYRDIMIDSLDNRFVFEFHSRDNRENYASFLTGFQIKSETLPVSIDLKYAAGLKKVMLFDHDPHYSGWPPPNDYYRKHVIYFSIQYFLK